MSQLRVLLMKSIQGTFLEHKVRIIKQTLRWNVPRFFLPRQSQIEILYDKRTIEFAREFLTVDSVTIDVGANNGSILSRLIEIAPLGLNIAFEPNPFFAQYLKVKFPCAEIREVALSDSKGITDFYRNLDSPALSTLEFDRSANFARSDLIQVEKSTLDIELSHLTRIDFLKIDVEGHELEVLKGAETLLNLHQPAIVVEISNETEMEIRCFLESLFYRVDYLLPGGDLSKFQKTKGSQPTQLGLGYLKAVSRKLNSRSTNNVVSP